MTNVISMEQARLARAADVSVDELVPGCGMSPTEYISALVATGELPHGFRLHETPGLATWVIDAPSMLAGLPFPHLHPAWGSGLVWSGVAHLDGSDLARRLLIDQASRSYILTRTGHVDSLRLREVTP